MKKLHHIFIIFISVLGLLSVSCSKDDTSVQVKSGKPESRLKAVPANPNNLVAYYAFDATPSGQGKLRLTDFTDNANIVVLFEGSIFELGDSVHYGSSSSYILNINGGPYKYYKQIINDVHALQARGIKVLMNVDDAASWQTTTPFTDYTGAGKTYTQYAALINQMAQAVPFDGIALDVEHFSGSANTNFTNLVREFGKYFGPLSSNPSNTIYTAAIYSGAAAGDAIGKNTTTALYFNFVEDMGYFQDNTTRFNQYANVIGAGKVMDGMSWQYNTQADAITYVNWMKSVGGAGVMVFAGNVSKTYTDAIFAAVGGGCSPTALTPYVNVNNGGWQQTNTASLSAGGTVVLGPGPNSGTWSWTGPGGFTASTREITLSNIQTSQAGNYVATNTNSCGAQSTVTFTITVNGSSGGSQTQVSLSSSFNASYGISTNGTTFGSTSGLDSEGYGYSSSLLSSSVSWNSTTFTLGSANTSDAVSCSGQTITLPSGSFTYLRMLATGVGGNRTSQSFVVNYSDGTTSTFTQSLSDWCTPQNYSGESKAVTMSYRNRYNGTSQTLTCNLYGYTFSINSAKTVSSIRLPNNSKVRVLAFTLVP